MEQFRIQRLAGSVYAGREFGNWGRSSVAFTRGSGDREIRIGDPSTPDEDFDIGELSFTLEADRLDDRFFPKTGHAASVTYRFSDTSFGATDDFEQLLGNGSIVLSKGDNVLILSADYRSTTSGVAPPERLFRAGGLFNLSGFEYNQLSGQNFAKVAGTFRRDLIDTGFVDVSVGASIEYGNVWQTRSAMSFDDAIFAGSVFLGADTPLGPLFVGWGHAETTDGTFYVSLGAVRNDPVLQ